MKCFSVLGLMAAAALSGVATAQNIFTQWTFDNQLSGQTNNAPTPSTGVGKAVPLGMTNNYMYSTSPPRTGSITTCDLTSAGASSDPGTPNYCWRVRGSYDGTLANAGIGWALAAPQYTQGAEFDVSTVNYGNIQFQFDWFTTNQGVNNMQVQYSLDGGSTWHNIGGILGGVTGTHNNAWINGGTARNPVVDFSGIPGANDNPNFRVRLVSVYDPTAYQGIPANTTYTGASGGVYNNNSGNWRFDMVTFTGTPLRSIGPAVSELVSAPAICTSGGTLTFTATVQSGVNPVSTGLAVTADLSPFGLSATQTMYDDGTHGDAVAGDGVYTYQATIPGGQTVGNKTINATVTDAQSRSANSSVSVAVGDCTQNSGAAVVISQTFGAGGKLGSTPDLDSPFDADFVELYNRSGSPVDLTGWSVQYADGGTTTGFSDPTQVVPLGGMIQPGQHILVQMSDPVGGFNALPTPDFAQLKGQGGMSDIGGLVVLAKTTSLIGTAFNGPNVEDFVGYGTASNFEGAGPAPSPNPASDTGDVRNGGGTQDTNQNFNDFSVGTPVPHNRAQGGFLAGYPASDIAAVCAGSTVTLYVQVAPGSSSTGIQVSGDVSAIVGSPTSVQLYDDGSHGDVSPNDDIFTLAYTVPSDASQGVRTVTFTVTDAQGHSDTSSIQVQVGNCGESFSPVVISQVYGGGGNSSSGFNADYAEIFNRSGHSVDMTGWSFQSCRVSDAGFDQRICLLSGVINPGEYRLIVVATPGPTGAVLPDADFVPSPPFNMESSFGRTCLVSTSNLVHQDYNRPDVVDLVGYGSQAESYLGVGPTPTLSDILVAVRKDGGCQDSRQNAIDFEADLALMLPHNSKSATNVCPARTCPADLNGDNQVDDSDFVIFAQAYNVLVCSDPAMPIGCWADLNGDNQVDDTDFVLFAAAYNALVCP